jgi:hypothetical protein
LATDDEKLGGELRLKEGWVKSRLGLTDKCGENTTESGIFSCFSKRANPVGIGDAKPVPGLGSAERVERLPK